jgi:antagonist of KipI
MTITVRNAGLLTTVQDLGRYGYAHLGISPAGAADQLSFRVANLLAGNDENAPALEMTLTGATLEFETRAIIALAGAECECKLGAYAVPNRIAIEVPAGGVLTCGTIKGGARTYLAFQGGLEIPLVMGSASTQVGAQFGGFHGRKLQRGDVLRLGRRRARCLPSPSPAAFDFLCASGTIRLTRGAQQDWFSPEAFQTLFSTPYLVKEQSDRTGVRLQGKAVEPREKSQLLTDGVPLGAMQVPQGGQPIILFVDQQTTGGYPKIASVIAADLHWVGQLRPRDQVRFSEVSIAQALQLLREQEQQLRRAFAEQNLRR